MSTEWGHPINSLEYQLRKAEELLPDFKEAAEAAQLRYDDHVAKLEAHKAALEVLKRAAEAEGREVEYSPADGEQAPRFRVGQKVEVSSEPAEGGWIKAGTVGTVKEVDPASTSKTGSWYSVDFPDVGTYTMRSDRLKLWEPPRNAEGLPIIVGNVYQLNRPEEPKQHRRTVKVKGRHEGGLPLWHVEFEDTKTDIYAKADELV